MRDDDLLSVMLAPTASAPDGALAYNCGIIVLELGVRAEGQPSAATLAQVLIRMLR